MFVLPKQCNPVLKEQEAEPHWHAASFAITPSVLLHGASVWQLLAESVHRKPVPVEHPTEPQMQIASLGVVPSVWVQSGAVRQRQEYCSEEHVSVETVSMFQFR